jgi:hypothetical protein
MAKSQRPVVMDKLSSSEHLTDGGPPSVNGWNPSPTAWLIGVWALMRAWLMGPLHTRAKSREGEMLESPNEMSKGPSQITEATRLCNFDLHNVTHPLIISPNPREHMFSVQISTLIVTFLSLMSQVLSFFIQTTKEVNPHPHIMPCVCASRTGTIFWSVWWSLVCRGCSDAKEGLRFCALEVVGEEVWIDQL